MKTKSEVPTNPWGVYWTIAYLEKGAKNWVMLMDFDTKKEAHKEIRLLNGTTMSRGIMRVARCEYHAIFDGKPVILK